MVSKNTLQVLWCKVLVIFAVFYEGKFFEVIKNGSKLILPDSDRTDMSNFTLSVIVDTTIIKTNKHTVQLSHFLLITPQQPSFFHFFFST